LASKVNKATAAWSEEVHEEIDLESKIAAKLHPQLKLHPGWCLEIKNLSARIDENGQIFCDLSKFWLPANRLYPSPQRLTSQPHLAAAAVLAVNDYWTVADSEKGQHTRALDLLAAIAKFFEYCWLNSKYRLDQLSEVDFTSLANDLAQGGWQFALNIRSRLKSYCLTTNVDEINSLFTKESINTVRFCEVIATNVRGREPKIYLEALKEINSTGNQIEREEAVSQAFVRVMSHRPSVSMLRGIFQHINRLYHIPFDLGLNFVPYPKTVSTAKKLGRQGGRTRNIGAQEATQMFAESFRWIYRYGPPLVKLVDEMCESVIKAYTEGREVLGYDLDALLKRSENAIWLNSKLPFQIEHVDIVKRKRKGISVRSALLNLFSGCFFLIGVMNGRRRDEISHRKYGLHSGMASVVNRDLKLFSAEFYIEKSLCDYLTFYVNEVTFDAITLLESLEKCFDKVDEAMGIRQADAVPARQRTLFSYRRFGRIKGVNEKRCWYNFDVRPDEGASGFISLALGQPDGFDLAPHMLRRAYALIFVYRYKNSTLQALAQQLVHLDLSMSMTYVTDPAFIDNASSIAEKFDVTREERRIAYAREFADIQNEIALVSDELLVETVLEVLSGQPCAGGYARFIKKIYSKFSTHVEFDGKDLAETSKALSGIMKARGHSPKTMEHGQCMAGTTSSTHIAKCRNRHSGELQRKMASANTCASCIYHHTNADYLKNLRADLTILSEKCDASPSLERQRAIIERDNLLQIISLQEKRMNFAEIAA
jgi:hypothetical protein